MSQPELISFDLCPFVQRSVITLQEKGVDFTLTYIDLDDKPAWFVKRAPFGQVPLLLVDDATLFESAVINEYLDEVYPPAMQPRDPLQRARNRAWTAFCDSLLGAQYRLMTASSASDFDDQHHAIEVRLWRLEEQLQRQAQDTATRGPYFNGTDYALIDSAYAPLFLRFALLDDWHSLSLYEETPRVAAWQAALCQRPTTRSSVTEDFSQRLAAYIATKGNHAGRVFRPG